MTLASYEDLQPLRRSFYDVEGDRTSIQLESLYWEMIESKCAKLKMSWQDWLREMHTASPAGVNFTSFVRASLVKAATRH